MSKLPKSASVFIALPIHRAWLHESEDFLKQNIQGALNWEIHSLFKLYEESLIQRARNKILKEFLETDATHLFFMDDDICLIKPFSIDLLVAADKDIIGGPYVTKKPPYHPVYYPLTKEYPDTREMKNPFEVIYQGTGCMLIKRKVCEDLARKFKYPFDCFEADIPFNGLTYLSEDWAFCHRARQRGFHIWIHPEVEIAHVGVYAYSVNDYYHFNKIETGGNNG